MIFTGPFPLSLYISLEVRHPQLTAALPLQPFLFFHICSYLVHAYINNSSASAMWSICLRRIGRHDRRRAQTPFVSCQEQKLYCGYAASLRWNALLREANWKHTHLFSLQMSQWQLLILLVAYFIYGAEQCLNWSAGQTSCKLTTHFISVCTLIHQYFIQKRQQRTTSAARCSWLSAKYSLHIHHKYIALLK